MSELFFAHESTLFWGVLKMVPGWSGAAMSNNLPIGGIGTVLKQFLNDECGTVSVEYGFAILFAGGICAAILTVVRDEVSSAFTIISNRLENSINTVKI